MKRVLRRSMRKYSVAHCMPECLQVPCDGPRKAGLIHLCTTTPTGLGPGCVCGSSVVWIVPDDGGCQTCKALGYHLSHFVQLIFGLPLGSAASERAQAEVAHRSPAHHVGHQALC